MAKDPPARTSIVETGATEPSAAELKKKQAAILKKLSGITPDQIKDYRSSSLDADFEDEAKISWQKTVWAK